MSVFREVGKFPRRPMIHAILPLVTTLFAQVAPDEAPPTPEPNPVPPRNPVQSPPPTPTIAKSAERFAEYAPMTGDDPSAYYDEEQGLCRDPASMVSAAPQSTDKSPYSQIDSQASLRCSLTEAVPLFAANLASTTLTGEDLIATQDALIDHFKAQWRQWSPDLNSLIGPMQALLNACVSVNVRFDKWEAEVDWLPNPWMEQDADVCLELGISQGETVHLMSPIWMDGLFLGRFFRFQMIQVVDGRLKLIDPNCPVPFGLNDITDRVMDSPAGQLFPNRRVESIPLSRLKNLDLSGVAEADQLAGQFAKILTNKIQHIKVKGMLYDPHIKITEIGEKCVPHRGEFEIQVRPNPLLDNLQRGGLREFDFTGIDKVHVQYWGVPLEQIPLPKGVRFKSGRADLVLDYDGGGKWDLRLQDLGATLSLEGSPIPEVTVKGNLQIRFSKTTEQQEALVEIIPEGLSVTIPKVLVKGQDTASLEATLTGLVALPYSQSAKKVGLPSGELKIERASIGTKPRVQVKFEAASSTLGGRFLGDATLSRPGDGTMAMSWDGAVDVDGERPPLVGEPTRDHPDREAQWTLQAVTAGDIVARDPLVPGGSFDLSAIQHGALDLTELSVSRRVGDLAALSAHLSGRARIDYFPNSGTLPALITTWNLAGNLHRVGGVDIHMEQLSTNGALDFDSLGSALAPRLGEGHFALHSDLRVVRNGQDLLNVPRLKMVGDGQGRMESNLAEANLAEAKQATSTSVESYEEALLSVQFVDPTLLGRTFSPELAPIRIVAQRTEQDHYLTAQTHLQVSTTEPLPLALGAALEFQLQDMREFRLNLTTDSEQAIGPIRTEQGHVALSMDGLLPLQGIATVPAYDLRAVTINTDPPYRIISEGEQGSAILSRNLKVHGRWPFNAGEAGNRRITVSATVKGTRAELALQGRGDDHADLRYRLDLPVQSMMDRKVRTRAEGVVGLDLKALFDKQRLSIRDGQVSLTALHPQTDQPENLLTLSYRARLSRNPHDGRLYLTFANPASGAPEIKLGPLSLDGRTWQGESQLSGTLVYHPETGAVGAVNFGLQDAEGHVMQNGQTIPFIHHLKLGGELMLLHHTHEEVLCRGRDGCYLEMQIYPETLFPEFQKGEHQPRTVKVYLDRFPLSPERYRQRYLIPYLDRFLDRNGLNGNGGER